MSGLFICRYNKSHKMRQGKLLFHELKCPDRMSSRIVCCPFNSSHMVSFLKMEHHKKLCPDRPFIEECLHKEMVSFITSEVERQKRKGGDAEDDEETAVVLCFNQGKAGKDMSVVKSNCIVLNQACHCKNKEDFFNIGNDNGIIEYDEEEDAFYLEAQDELEENS